MLTVTTFFVLCQAVGAGIGALLAIWGELAYGRLVRAGEAKGAEQEYYMIMGKGLYYGMTTLLLSSMGFVVSSFAEGLTPQPALQPGYWILIMLSLLIIIASWMLVQRRIPFNLGSATLFCAWWFLVHLSLGWMPDSFGAAALSFAVVATIFYWIFTYLHLSPSQHQTSVQ